MEKALEAQILKILADHRIMSLATLRPDGWPQVTTVGYASLGLTLYFLCALDSQKAANLARDGRVSLTIDHDTPDLMAITGLSMAARAERVTDPAEGARVLALMPQKYPATTTLPMPMPTADHVAIFKLTPTVISVLDYTRGFGHSELVTL
jgi:nitroimidazol reductase NimA-like FMN-containing flavoprotein (pyridoxamine 5'-phosphate oxidase superfamily)